MYFWLGSGIFIIAIVLIISVIAFMRNRSSQNQ